MKKIAFVFFGCLIISGVSAQTFLNGDFENNTAVGDQINLSNAAYTAMMANSTAFGTFGDVDIITSATWGGSGAQSGNWYIAFTGGGSDMVSLTLSAPLVMGNNYTISFYDRADPGFIPMPFEIGLSTVPNAFGTNIYTAPVAPTNNVWTQRIFSFTAPNNGQYITINMTGPYSTSNWAHVDNFSFSCGLNLGPDTTICTGGAYMLNATTPDATAYLWQDGSTDSVFTVTTPGIYWAQVTTPACTISDTVNVNFGNVSLINIGNDTSVCLPDTLTLDATLTGATYLWSDGSSNSTISVFQTGEYAVTVSLSGCTSVDSMHLTENPKPPASVSANQTVFCSGDSAQICATAGMAVYNWNTGDTSSCIITQLAGNYYVTVTDVNGCSAASNHLAITVYSPPPVSVSVNGDSLSSYNAVTYQWFLNGSPIAGAISQIYIALQGGSYTVEVTDSNGCSAFSTAVIISGILTPGLSQGEEAISVYPNPSAVGNWQLTVGKELIGSQLEIFDDEGRLVFKDQISKIKNQIEIQEARGIYLLRISDEKNSITRKLVKL